MLRWYCLFLTKQVRRLALFPLVGSGILTCPLLLRSQLHQFLSETLSVRPKRITLNLACTRVSTILHSQRIPSVLSLLLAWITYRPQLRIQIHPCTPMTSAFPMCSASRSSSIRFRLFRPPLCTPAHGSGSHCCTFSARLFQRRR